MIKLPKRVLKRWHAIANDEELGRDTYIEVLFTTRLDRVAAADELTASLRRVQDEFPRSYAGSDLGSDDPFAGEWDVTPVPEGTLLSGGRKSDDGAAVLEGIATDLQRRGLSGKLDLFELPDIPPPPAGVGVIDACLRVIGRREPGVINARWSIDEAAYARVVRLAVDWCLKARPDRAVTLSSGVLPTMLVRRGESPFQRLETVMYREFLTTLSSVGGDHVRAVTLSPEHGRVSLLDGGPRLHRAGWEPAVDDLKSVLVEAAENLVYGRVRRERDFGRARSPETYHADRPRHYRLDAIPHEDHLAPDAFALQLLGPGYTSRLPDDEQWTTTELAAGRVLLEHVEPSGWFEEVTLAAAMRWEPVPPSALLERARDSLAPILFPDVPFERRSRPTAERHYVWLSQDIVNKIHALSTPPPHTVALVLDDGQLIENVDLSHHGALIERIGGQTEIDLDPRRVTDIANR